MNYSDYIHRLSNVGAMISRSEYNEIEELVQLSLREASADDSLTEVERNKVFAECERCLGDVDSEHGRYADAHARFNTALELCLTTDDEEYVRIIGAMANNYLRQELFAEAIEYYQLMLEKLEAKGNDVGLAGTLSNIGVVHYELGDFTRAFEFYTRALAYAEKANHHRFISNINNNLGIVSHCIGEEERAAYYLNTALESFEALGDKAGVVGCLNSLANVHRVIEEYDTAIELYNKSTAACKQVGDLGLLSMVVGNLGGLYCDMQNYDEALRLMNQSLCYAEENNQKRQVANACNNIATILKAMKVGNDYLERAETLLHRAIAINEQQQAKTQLIDNHNVLSGVYEEQQRWKEALHHRNIHQKLDNESRSDEAKKRVQNLEHQRKIEADERDRQVRLARFQEQEKILYNILPPVIAERVVAGERRIAESHDSVSILFADLVGFTKLSQQIGEDELIDTLDEVFSSFDVLTEKHGCEKIKTIGDCYMAVCGMPEATTNHAVLISALALDIRDCMNELNVKSRHQLNIRIGIHCGSVVSGILGKNKYAYDVWGDAVNTASRLESHGESGKVHISEEIMQAIFPSFSQTEESFGQGLQAIPRGVIEIKDKGPMRTYFLERV